MKSFASAILALALLSGTGAGLNRASLTLDPEADETGRGDLDGTGQLNCVPEALGRETHPKCGIVETGVSQPLTGIRLLDAFPGHFGPNPWANLDDPQGPAGSDPHQGFHSYPRSSRGAVPDLLYPGWTTFLALYGVWNDADGDTLVDWIRSGQSGGELNEWVSLRDADLVSYLYPGSHPQLLAEGRPGESDPDLTYAYDAWVYTSYGPVLYLDGSILTTYRVDTVSTPIFSPGPHQRPFTPREDSLVDVDRHAAYFGGTVEDLYAATAGRIVERAGSPNMGTLFEDGERLGVPTVHGTVAEPIVRPIFDVLYGPDGREWSLGSGSSAAGRRDVFNDTFAAWLDVRLAQRVIDASTNLLNYQYFATPLVGRGASGERASFTTRLAVSVHTGIWRDLNRDGFIGEADPLDPYEGGTRPDPDDYHAPRGEFFPIPARSGGQTTSTVVVRLTPDPSWGEPGVFVMRGGLPHAFGPDGDPCLPESFGYNRCVAPIERWHVTGSTPIDLRVTTGSDDFVAYRNADEVLLPEGTAGFSIEACVAPLQVDYLLAGENQSESAWDCDVVAPRRDLHDVG